MDSLFITKKQTTENPQQKPPTNPMKQRHPISHACLGMMTTEIPVASSSDAWRRSARGFTLVEILVVIAIIAVLTSLTFIGVRKGMDAAHNSGCISNLRGLATAGELYASEHGSYPNQGRQLDGSHTWWFQAMEVELGFEPGTSPSIIERSEMMPMCKKCLRTHGPGTNPDNRLIRTYSMNHDLIGPTKNSDGESVYPGLRSTRVVNPSATAFFMDGSVAGTGPYWQYLARKNQWLKEENFIHNGKANVVFLDGHVESFRLEDVPTNGDHPFWNPRATDMDAPKH